VSKESVSSVWRQIRDGCTKPFAYEDIGIVEFKNPGEERIIKFHGQFYWHKPIYDVAGKTVIGNELKWSLVPSQYHSLLRQIVVKKKVKC